MPQFVIVYHDAKNDYQPFESSKYFTLEKRRKFFWFEWWSPLKENGKVLKFNTYEDAKIKFKSFKK